MLISVSLFWSKFIQYVIGKGCNWYWLFRQKQEDLLLHNNSVNLSKFFFFHPKQFFSNWSLLECWWFCLIKFRFDVFFTWWQQLPYYPAILVIVINCNVVRSSEFIGVCNLTVLLVTVCKIKILVVIMPTTLSSLDLTTPKLWYTNC